MGGFDVAVWQVLATSTAGSDTGRLFLTVFKSMSPWSYSSFKREIQNKGHKNSANTIKEIFPAYGGDIRENNNKNETFYC